MTTEEQLKTLTEYVQALAWEVIKMAGELGKVAGMLDAHLGLPPKHAEKESICGWCGGTGTRYPTGDNMPEKVCCEECHGKGRVKGPV